MAPPLSGSLPTSFIHFAPPIRQRTAAYCTPPVRGVGSGKWSVLPTGLGWVSSLWLPGEDLESYRHGAVLESRDSRNFTPRRGVTPAAISRPGNPPLSPRVLTTKAKTRPRRRTRFAHPVNESHRGPPPKGERRSKRACAWDGVGCDESVRRPPMGAEPRRG